MKLSEAAQDKRKVLATLVDCYSEDFGFLSFKAISQRSGLPRDRIRRAVRFLARKGLAQFKAGLWTDDGEPYGSGYAATKAGQAHHQEAQP